MRTDSKHLIEILHQSLPLLAERYRVESLGVFGSYVRHDQRPGSDVDILVTFYLKNLDSGFRRNNNHQSDPGHQPSIREIS